MSTPENLQDTIVFKVEEQLPDVTQYREQETFQRVTSIEPKRDYVTSQVIRHIDGKRYLPQLNPDEFLEQFQKAREIVLSLTEEELDQRIAEEHYLKRLRAYNSVDWFRGVVYADEVGVWKGAGGLPIEWTYGSLEDTAHIVLQELGNGNNRIAARAKRAIPRMQDHLSVIMSESLLFPIILPGATEGRGRKGVSYKGFKKMKGDIDDGCMRSITFVCSGKISFPAYVGITHTI